MTVRAMTAEMPNTEFERWKVYYQRRAQQEELAEQKARGRR